MTVPLAHIGLIVPKRSQARRRDGTAAGPGRPARPPAQARVRDSERAFDQLNPNYGVPADERSRYGRQAVHDREAALALGVRVAVHDSRQNDRNPVIWQPGQDYGMADALHAARTQSIRVRWGPERLGPER